MSSEAVAADAVVDLRSTPHPQRHSFIFNIIGRMAAGKSFVLVNDHDPRPLHRHLQEAYGEMFAWEYLERGPLQWRVRISKAEERSES